VASQGFQATPPELITFLLSEEGKLLLSQPGIRRDGSVACSLPSDPSRTWTGAQLYQALQYHFRGQAGAMAQHLGALARQGGPGAWVSADMARAEQFIIADTLKPTEQRVIKGSWAGNTDANRHIGQQACEQEELRGFTKRQVYTKRDKMNQAGLVTVKVPKVKVPKV
jgi:hypothetical protein